MPRAPLYRTLIRPSSGSTFAPGPVAVELENSKNLGWSEYLNDVGESFFTLTQGDRKLLDMRDLLDAGAHVQQYRNDDLVWAGWLGESDETETDVVFYAYSYVSGLFWLHTGWDNKWLGQNLNVIVTESWVNIGKGATGSGLAWATTGTIETPVTTSGGSTAIILPSYSANYKRILFVLQELAAMAASDTTNRVAFEITPSGTFNFWKNRGTTQSTVKWQYGGSVLGYSRSRTPMDRRNTVFGVGASPRDIVLRRTDEDTADRTANSRREEALFYEWVRDATELERVNKLRLARALRIDNQLSLSFAPGRVTPARAAGADYALADMVPVLIENGMTQINEPKLVTGQQIIVVRGVEHVRALVQDRL